MWLTTFSSKGQKHDNVLVLCAAVEMRAWDPPVVCGFWKANSTLVPETLHPKLQVETVTSRREPHWHV